MDNNQINRDFVIEILKLQNMQCDIATNGKEAILACGDNNYDIIFMDGFEATK